MSLTKQAMPLEYANAGHCPPLLRRRAGGLIGLGSTGPILGILSDAHWRAASPVRLEPGDTLFLYTDGLYEARGAAGGRGGEEAMRRSFEHHAAAHGDARAILDGVLADVDAFRANVALEDDLTGLVVRRETAARGRGVSGMGRS